MGMVMLFFTERAQLLAFLQAVGDEGREVLVSLGFELFQLVPLRTKRVKNY